jgi:hypothetical protein
MLQAELSAVKVSVSKTANYRFKISKIWRMLGVPESMCKSIFKTFQGRGSLLKAKLMVRATTCCGDTRLLWLIDELSIILRQARESITFGDVTIAGKGCKI